MFYCYDERVPLESYNREIELAKSKQQAIFYNDIDGFRDSKGNKIDIKGMIIIPRTFVAQVEQINKLILENGGILAVSEVDDEVVESWSNYYKPKRKVIIVNGEDLINKDVISELRRSFGEKIFLKTKSKNFNGIVSISLLEDQECNFYKALLNNLATEFIVSSAVDILKDNYGLREYRCFILNDRVANISRYTEDVLHTIDKEILDKAREIVELLKGIMPSYYVMDLFEYEVDGRKEIDVVEFNPIQSSGIYLYNSAIEESYDLLHENTLNIPFEYSDKKDECSYDGTMINKREPLYKLSNSFANDLMCICLSGSVGLSFFSDVKINPDAYAKHGGMFNFGTFSVVSESSELDYSLGIKPIMSDDDLSDSKKLKFLKEDKKDE